MTFDLVGWEVGTSVDCGPTDWEAGAWVACGPISVEPTLVAAVGVTGTKTSLAEL